MGLGSLFKKQKRRILLVEDEKDYSDTIKYMLEQTGLYTVIQAFDGQQALDQVEKHSRWLGFARNKIQAIILDLKMPNMNGIQFLKALRKEEYFATRMPVIILSAYEDRDKWLDVTDNREGYVCHYLKKPVEKADLLEVVRGAVNYEVDVMIQKTKDQVGPKFSELGNTPIEKI